MPEIARWKIRPVAIGDISGNVQDLERTIIPVYGPVLIGTLGGDFPEPAGEWNYELIETNEQTSRFLTGKITQKKPQLESLVKNAVFQAIIRINPRKFRHISRFHAMLGTINGDLYIADLESKNGTYAGTKIEPSYPLMLTGGQTIKLGGRQEDCAQIKVYEAIKEAYALLVGADYKREADKSIEKTIWQMDHLIRKLRVPYECNILTHENATKEEIMHYLQMAERLPEKSLFFFFCSMHGSKYRFTTASQEEQIKKREISASLNSIKAKKIVIIDSCYAEGGWETLDLESGLYFFSSKEDEKSKWETFAPRLAERITELLNKGLPVDMKKLEISDLVKRENQNPVKKGHKSVILF
ncbi:FHA domain-containing protein [Candidatus Woesearchaeota archaeon]|nr:FHA domain-containing protein [Candidatus Woesearchaeota archaeon]MBW3006349.1 FHA domain-containing protein [Candidatus Woesearchaeota archaeon]